MGFVSKREDDAERAGTTMDWIDTTQSRPAIPNESNTVNTGVKPRKISASKILKQQELLVLIAGEMSLHYPHIYNLVKDEALHGISQDLIRTAQERYVRKIKRLRRHIGKELYQHSLYFPESYDDALQYYRFIYEYDAMDSTLRRISYASGALDIARNMVARLLLQEFITHCTDLPDTVFIIIGSAIYNFDLPKMSSGELIHRLYPKSLYKTSFLPIGELKEVTANDYLWAYYYLYSDVRSDGTKNSLRCFTDYAMSTLYSRLNEFQRRLIPDALKR